MSDDALEIIAGGHFHGSLRERIKRGEISPQSALQAIKAREEGLTSEQFRNWCHGAGQKRYDAAVRKAAQTEKKIDIEAQKGDTPSKRQRRKDRK
jgi:hypothetical protein